MNKAQSLAEIIRNFNPLLPLKNDFLTNWYVDRPYNRTKEIKTYLQGLALHQMPVKLLFTGHTGSGKSTELNRLAKELKNQFFIVPFEAHKSLSLADMTHTDLIIGMAISLFKRATEEDVIHKAPAKIATDYWQDLSKFIENVIFGPTKLPSIRPEIEASAKINLLAIEFQSKFASQSHTRKEVREHLEPRLAELHSKIDDVCNLIETNYKRPVLFFIEGTDKADFSRAQNIFLNHSYSLTAFQASVIYTFPIALRYSTKFRQIEDFFNQTYVLPNIKVFERDGKTSQEGFEILKRAIEVRIKTDLMTNEAKKAIINASGGLMRTLIRLVQSAAVNALAAGQSEISLKNADFAIKEERADFVAALKENDYPILLARHKDKRLSADDELMPLLQARALLEYANNEPWCDVHPIALPLVLERTK